MQIRTVRTVCPYCAVGCNVIVTSDGKRIISVVPSKRNDINYGSLCIKGWKGFDAVTSKERLKNPMKRTERGFVEISWEEAVDIVVKNLSEIKRKYGPDALAFIASARCTNEDNYLMQKLARQVFGTNNIDHCARLCHSPSVEGLISTFGRGAATTSIADLDNAELYFIIGTNITEHYPILGARIINNVMKGKKLIVADPRNIHIAKFATLHLRLLPGTDLALLNTMANVIVKKGLYDKKFIEERTENFDEYLKVIEYYDLERGSKITGVDPELIEKASVLYATSRSVILYSLGVTQHVQGVQTVQAIANLAMLTGNVGKPGTGVFPIRGQNNVQGAGDMGALCDFLPGYVRVDDENGRRKFEEAWNCKLPSKPGLSLPEMFWEAYKGNVKAMYIMGENPVISESELGIVEEALKKLEFLVVQDIFMTETAEFAHVVLPAKSFAEKLGTFTNTERRIQLIRPFLDPPGNALDDWKIFQLIARKMGYDWNYNSPEDIMAEISKLVPQYKGVTYDCLSENGVQWPVNESCKGTEILYTEKFARSNGKGRFMPAHWERPSDFPDEEYPFILTTGGIYYQYTTGTMTRKVHILEREAPSPFVEINPEDAKSLGIRDGELVTVKSRYGELDVRARISDSVPRGILFIPFHYREAPVNRIVNPHIDPKARTPEFKVTAVKIVKKVIQ